MIPGQHITDEDLPGLYKTANHSSLLAQQAFLRGLGSYLAILVLATSVAFFGGGANAALLSAVFFVGSLAVLIGLRVKRPDDLWYNGRAVAESVKTRAWRWVMRAEPYENCDDVVVVKKQFITDLKAILSQNRSLVAELSVEAHLDVPISEAMIEVRGLAVQDRLARYQVDRIQDQADWYSKKSIFNRKRAKQWFWVSVALHVGAVVLLLLRARYPEVKLPVEVLAAGAGAVLTWLQAKKHNELGSSYSLAAHEIVLIKGEALSIHSEELLSEFVVNAEAAFSREHTQWAARKND